MCNSFKNFGKLLIYIWFPWSFVKFFNFNFDFLKNMQKEDLYFRSYEFSFVVSGPKWGS